MKWIIPALLMISISVFAKTSNEKGVALPPDSEVQRSWGAASLPAPERRIRAVSWNIYKANKPEDWERAMSALTHEADLVFGQEGWTVPAFTRFVQAPFGFVWTFTTSYQHRGYDTGIFFGSRFPLKSVKWHRSPGREPILETPKMATSAILPLRDGRELLAINIHSINFVWNREFERQLVPLFREIQNHQGPVIFAGDFNTWNQERTAFLFKRTKELKMSGIGFIEDPRRRKIDHIFHRDLGLRDARVRADISTSDHWPLTAVFSLNPAEDEDPPKIQEPRL